MTFPTFEIYIIYNMCMKKYRILIDNEHYIIIIGALFEFRVYYVSDQI